MISAILGQKIVRRQLIKQSSRFRTERVTTAEKDFLLKIAVKPEFNSKIRQQGVGAEKLAGLLRDISWLSAERVIANGENWLVVEWLPDGPLATKEQFQAGQNLGAIDKFVRIAAQLDDAAVANLDITVKKPIRLSRHRLEPKVYSQNVAEKFEPFLGRPDFNEPLVKAGLEYFEQRIASFTACYQHGDLTPWHILKKGKQFVVVDCEHVSDDWPRFYDIANFYSKLNVEFDLNNKSEKMMDGFAKIRQEDARASDAFWTAVMLRSLRRAIEHQAQPEIVQRAFKVTDTIISR